MADGESESRHVLAEVKPSRGKFVSSNVDATNRLPDGCNADSFLRCESANTAGSFGSVGEFFASNNSVLHWAESFDALLEDLDGVSLFRLFLEQCDAAKCLEFLFACRGLKLTVSATDKSSIYRTVKAIYRKYLQNSGSGESVVTIDSRTKRAISERLYHKSTIDRNVLDAALEQVEQHLRHRWYPRFLQSKLYLQYVETHSQSVYEPMSLWSSYTPVDISPNSQQNPLPCIPSTNSGATTVLTSSKPFPTSANPPLTRENLVISSSYRSQTPLSHSLLTTPAAISHEHKTGYNEGQVMSLQFSHHQQQHVLSTNVSGPSTNPSARESNILNQQKPHTSRRRMTRSSSVHCYQKHSSKQLNSQSARKWPQQSSFLPTSVQESELQSLSSEAFTDDTYSYTDSSLVDSLRRLRSPGAVPPIGQTFPRFPRNASGNQGGSHIQECSGTKESTKSEHNPNAPNPQAGGGGGGKERCLAEVDPGAFAKLLTERLLLVINRKSNIPSGIATMSGTVNSTKAGDDSINTSTSQSHQQVQQRLPSILCQPWAGKLLAAAAKSACAREDQQAAQTILEEHCSRVWHTPPQIYPCNSSSGGTGMSNDGGSGALASSDDVIIPNNSINAILGVGTMGDCLIHQHVHTTAEHRHIHHYHYPHHYVPLISSGAAKESERISMSGGRMLSATQQQGSTFMGASDASSNIDSGVSLIYDTSSSAGPSTTAALISQPPVHPTSTGDAKHRGDTLLSHPSQLPVSSPSNPCQHQHLKPSKLLNTSGWMTDSFASSPTSKHISQNLYIDSTQPIQSNAALKIGHSVPPIQTVSMGGAVSSCSNTNTSSSKPYPAQQKVLAWMMESKELPPSSSSAGLCYMTDQTCSIGDASSYAIPGLTECISNTCHISEKPLSTESFWNQKSFIRSPCPPSYLMYMGGTMSKSHSFPVEDTERTSNTMNQSIPSVSTERTEISNQTNVLDQSICSTLTKSVFAHNQSNSKSSPFTGCPNTPSTSRMVHFQPDDSVNQIIHPTCSISNENKHLPPPSGNSSCGLVVGYYLCDDPVPYRSHWPASEITLSQFKQIVAKKGHFRYFFKTTSDEFETGVVHQEVVCDQSILPLWEGKVVAKIERVE